MVGIRFASCSGLEVAVNSAPHQTRLHVRLLNSVRDIAGLISEAFVMPVGVAVCSHLMRCRDHR